jgi:hypothetical protein
VVVADEELPVAEEGLPVALLLAGAAEVVAVVSPYTVVVDEANEENAGRVRVVVRPLLTVTTTDCAATRETMSEAVVGVEKRMVLLFWWGRRMNDCMDDMR